MKKKIFNFSIHFLCILFLIYPIFFGLSSISFMFIFLALFDLIVVILNKTKINIKINEKHYLHIIIALSILTRVITVLLFNKHLIQVSDFGHALSNSVDLNFSSNYYRVFTHWILYPIITSFVYKIFGSGQLVALLLNAFILTLVSVMVYKVAELVLNNKKFAFLAALIYIFWPANDLYTLIYTQEHLGTLILLLSLYLFLKINTSKPETKKDILLMLLVGIMLGISIFFKNFAPVFIISFVCYYLMLMLSQKKVKKTLIKALTVITVIFIGFTVTKNLTFMLCDHLVGAKVARNIVPCYLNVGLRGNGTYNSSYYTEYYILVEKYNYDFDKVNAIVMKNLKKHISNKNSEVYKNHFFRKKAGTIINGDSARIYWVKYSINSKEYIDFIKVINHIYSINNKYYYIIMFSMAICLLYIIYSKNLNALLLYIIIHGSFLMLLLVEAQNRYMYSIQPLMCILAVPGLITIYNFINNRTKIIKILKIK